MSNELSRAKLQRMRDAKNAAQKFISVFDLEAKTSSLEMVIGEDPLKGFDDSQYFLEKLRTLLDSHLTFTDLNGKVSLVNADGEVIGAQG